MKHLLLSSLLSCMLIGQVFAVDHLQDTVTVAHEIIKAATNETSGIAKVLPKVAKTLFEARDEFADKELTWQVASALLATPIIVGCLFLAIPLDN